MYIDLTETRYSRYLTEHALERREVVVLSDFIMLPTCGISNTP